MTPPKLLCFLLLAILSAGCGGATTGGRPAGKGDLEKLQREMTAVFSALEMYAHDHSLAYPDTTSPLVPKYLDKLPSDPLTGRPLGYQRTERGYLLLSQGDYGGAGAEAGYPRMDQDGFFALKATDFPTLETAP